MTNYEKLVETLRWTANEYKGSIMDEYDKDTMNAAADAIEALQAQLPKRGEWELIDGAEPMRWGCSRCKYMSWETSTYCPRCGSHMVGENDERN